MVPAYKLPQEPVQTTAPPRERPRSRPVRSSVRRVNPYVVLPIVGLLLFAAGLALVHQRVQAISLTYELEAARQQLAVLRQTNARLQVAVAGAVSLERAEAAARTRLGMVDPASRTAVVVTPEAIGTTPMIAETSSPWAHAAAWLRKRLMMAAEAGERASR